MKNGKISRLTLGLIILFSFFVFQGSDDHHGCTQCEDEILGGALTVINNTGLDIMVTVQPLGGTAGLAHGGTKVFYLNEGLYQVVALEFFTFVPKNVIGVRMVEIKLGSDKSVTFK